MNKSSVVVETVNDEVIDLECMECRDTQISCMAARSLAEPLEACRPWEGRKTRSAQEPRSTWQSHQARTPQGGLHSRRKIHGCLVQAGKAYKSTPTSEGHASGVLN
jgi:hypothetical protein